MSVANEERNYTVYMHVNKINGKKYIGITGQNPPEKRFRNGNGYSHNSYFGKSISKYGWNNFYHIYVGKGLTKEEAEYFEILLIAKLDTTNHDKGYNIEHGGNSIGKISNETKLKMKENHADFTNENHPNAKKVKCDGKIYNCVGDCEDKYKIKRRTMSSWLTGKRSMPQEFIDLGLRYLDDENFIPKSKKHPRAKQVECDNKIFDSIKDCADYYGEIPTTMAQWLNKTRTMSQKFIDLGLKYLDDNETIYQPRGENNKGKQIICDNKVFKSIKLCAEYYKINYDTMKYWLKVNKIPQQYIDLELRYYNPEVDGNIEQYEQYIETKGM